MAASLKDLGTEVASPRQIASIAPAFAPPRGGAKMSAVSDGRKPVLAKDVTDNASLRAATAVEQAVGATGPANWSRMALLGVVIVAFILLMLQVFQGAPGTAVQSGTPVAEPVVQPASPAQ